MWRQSLKRWRALGVQYNPSHWGTECFASGAPILKGSLSTTKDNSSCWHDITVVMLFIPAITYSYTNA